MLEVEANPLRIGVLAALIFNSVFFTMMTAWESLSGTYDFSQTFLTSLVTSIALGLYFYWRACQEETDEGGIPSKEMPASRVEG